MQYLSVASFQKKLRYVLIFLVDQSESENSRDGITKVLTKKSMTLYYKTHAFRIEFVTVIPLMLFSKSCSFYNITFFMIISRGMQIDKGKNNSMSQFQAMLAILNIQPYFHVNDLQGTKTKMTLISHLADAF